VGHRTEEGFAVSFPLGGRTHRVTYSLPVAPMESSHDALLPITLMPAMRVGEDLDLPAGLSRQLTESVPLIQDILLTWDRYQWDLGMSRVDVQAEARASCPAPTGRGVGCFFSGGVDSSYSVLKHRDEVTHLIFVHGFDVSLGQAALRSVVADALRSAAASLGKPLLEVETDLRSFSDPVVSWPAYHGAALASVALLLAPMLSKVYVPASDTFATLSPYGSHPLLDPLWSTEALTIVHDGCEASRADKVAAFATDSAPLEWLRVCWKNPGNAYNCGRCTKCVRTMVTLRMAGLLDSCPTFPQGLDLARVAASDLRQPQVRVLWTRYLRSLEASNADPPLARAVAAALDGSGWIQRAHRGARGLRRQVARLDARLLARSPAASPIPSGPVIRVTAAADGTDLQLNRVRDAMERFVEAEPGRSVAVERLGQPALTLGARAAVVRPAASLVKVPLVLAVYDAAHDGLIDLEVQVARRNLGATRFASVLDVVGPDHGFSVRELCGLTLATSDNLAANYLIDLVGADRINAVFTKAGCEVSAFAVGFAEHELGPVGRRNVTSAGDAVRLFAYLDGEPHYAEVVAALANNLRNLRLPLRLPEDIQVAHKTGTLEGVVNDAGIIRDERLAVVMAVLCDGQRDSARTSLAIGDMASEVWELLGGRTTARAR